MFQDRKPTKELSVVEEIRNGNILIRKPFHYEHQVSTLSCNNSYEESYTLNLNQLKLLTILISD